MIAPNLVEQFLRPRALEHLRVNQPQNIPREMDIGGSKKNGDLRPDIPQGLRNLSAIGVGQQKIEDAAVDLLNLEEFDAGLGCFGRKDLSPARLKKTIF